MPSSKAWEDATRSISAVSPSTESGPAPLAVNASTDDAPRIQAMLNYLAATYGGGKLLLSPGTSIVKAGITIPDRVQVVGSELCKWDFWFAPDGTTFVTFTGSHQTPIRGLYLNGNQYDANTGQANTTTTTGLRITGNHLTVEDLHIHGAGVGIDVTQDDTYLIAFDRVRINSCRVAVNADLANVYGAGTASSNSGERLSFTNSLIANCGTGFLASGSGCGLHFTNTSMDFTNLFGRIQDAHVFFTNCHLETTGVPASASASAGGTRLPYLFDCAAAARLTIAATNFIMGSPGVYTAVNTAVAPPGPWGMADFAGCHAYYVKPAAAGAAVRAEFSEPVVQVPTGATTVTVSSFFVTRWNPVTATLAAYNGNPAANVTARITGMNVAAGTVTVTLSAAAPANTYLRLDF